MTSPAGGSGGKLGKLFDKLHRHHDGSPGRPAGRGDSPGGSSGGPTAAAAPAATGAARHLFGHRKDAPAGGGILTGSAAAPGTVDLASGARDGAGAAAGGAAASGGRAASLSLSAAIEEAMTGSVYGSMHGSAAAAVALAADAFVSPLQSPTGRGPGAPAAWVTAPLPADAAALSPPGLAAALDTPALPAAASAADAQVTRPAAPAQAGGIVPVPLAPLNTPAGGSPAGGSPASSAYGTPRHGVSPSVSLSDLQQASATAGGTSVSAGSGSGASGSTAASVGLEGSSVAPAALAWNSVLLRVGFEMLRSPAFESWLRNLIQKKLDDIKRPPYVHRYGLSILSVDRCPFRMQLVFIMASAAGTTKLWDNPLDLAYVFSSWG